MNLLTKSSQDEFPTAFLLYRKLRPYTVKNFDYIAVQIFLKALAFKKCSRLVKSEFAPHFRRRRCGEAAFLVSLFVQKHIFS